MGWENKDGAFGFKAVFLVACILSSAIGFKDLSIETFINDYRKPDVTLRSVIGSPVALNLGTVVYSEACV